MVTPAGTQGSAHVNTGRKEKKKILMKNSKRDVESFISRPHPHPLSSILSHSQCQGQHMPGTVL